MTYSFFYIVGKAVYPSPLQFKTALYKLQQPQRVKSQSPNRFTNGTHLTLTFV